jgi:hypothetical protein
LISPVPLATGNVVFSKSLGTKSRRAPVSARKLPYRFNRFPDLWKLAVSWVDQITWGDLSNPRDSSASAKNAGTLRLKHLDLGCVGRHLAQQLQFF